MSAAIAFEILARGGLLAAIEQHARVVREAAQRRERLVQFMRDAGRHLAERGELARLDQFVVRGAQLLLRADPVADFLLQLLVRFRQIGRTLLDAPVQLRVRLLQQRAATDHLAHAARRIRQ